MLALRLPVAVAVPANPEPAEFTQPDGTVIKLHLRGDEYFHWHEDLHGFTVVCAPNREYVYASLDADGGLVPTALSVGKDDPYVYGLQKRILPPRSVRKQLRRSREPQNQPSQSIPLQNQTLQEQAPLLLSGSAAAPGTILNLVVLVSFSNLTVDYPTDDFNDLFNQIGYSYDGAAGSVKDFYHEVSYNNLTAESTVVEPVTLDRRYSYYGRNDVYGYDVRPREMVAQALAKLEARGFDFSTMDGDGDGWVDSLTIIHAGGGEEYAGNPSDYIWSHKWRMISTVTYDGVSMWDYFTVPARRGWDSTPSTWGITRIGVVCHEMGHFLGLPDLYDYDYDSEGAGVFCLMAGGSWNGSYGTSPSHPSAWCKVDLGWVAPSVISVDDYYTLPAVENEPNIYKLQGSFASNEYFLIENRQGIGFDSQLPGSQKGLLIWHVDENQPDNDDQTHYKVDLEEASGIQHLELNQNDGEDSDYFRASNATQFTDYTVPDNLSYSGIPLGIDITDVGPTGTVMQIKIGWLPFVDFPDPINNGTNIPVDKLLSWVLVFGGDCETTYDIYFDTINPPVTLLCDDINETLCDPVLSCSTTYYWQVIATNCYGTVPGPVWSFTTLSLTGDFNSDCINDYNDLLQIADNWLLNQPAIDIAPPGGDGIINLKDLATFALYWLDQLTE